MKEPAKLLVVDDEKIALQNLSHVLLKEGYSVTGANSGPEAIKLLEKEQFDLVLTDLKMARVDGYGVMERSRELYPDTEVIIITGFASIDSAIETMKKGAYHYIAKPYKLDEVRKVVRDALEKSELRRENRQLKKQLQTFHGSNRIITHNQNMKKLLEMARQVAETNSTILLTGESGTGKELLARFIHENSQRKNGPRLSLNCGVFSEELLANELFGHEKGAFTGATDMKKGLVEMADGGTLFLDEITEMSPAMQVKLLRVLQEKEVQRVGGTTPIKIDVRFIAATNRDIQEEVAEGNFRQDLYFRINVVSLRIPPLAERKDDIPLLCHHFIEKYANLTGKKVTDISPEALEILASYDFPGNVRELENVIERGVALTKINVIDVKQLPEDLRGLSFQTFRRKDGEMPSLNDQEKAYIKWVLQETKGNKTTAAQILGIDRVSLWRKLKKYDLDSES